MSFFFARTASSFVHMERILVVDDNLDVRENTAELLEHYGYQTLSATHGQEGYMLALLTLPDLIICDITMPVTDGLGMLKLLKNNERTKNIPIIFFSAGSAPLEVRKGLEQGANAYVSKPFTDEDLLGAIRKCLKDGASGSGIRN